MINNNLKILGVLLYIFLYFAVSSGVEAQETPIYFQSQYLFDPYLINPAYAGCKDFTAIKLSARQNFTNITGSPKTQIISVHSRLGESMDIFSSTENSGSYFTNIGLGGYLFNDVSAAFRKIGIQLTYAYHLPLSRKHLRHLSFGISANALIYSFSPNSFNIITDPLLNQGSKTTFVPDANLGVYYYGIHLFAGLSSSNIFKNSIKLDAPNYSEIPIDRKYFLLLGYKFNLSKPKGIILEPSVLVRTNDEEISSFYENIDITLKLYFTRFFVGTSYRYNESFVVAGLYHFDYFYIGLAYEYPVGDIWNYTYGNTQIVIGVNLGRGKNRFGDSRYW